MGAAYAAPLGGDASVSAVRKTPAVRDLEREAEAAQALRVALATQTDDEECIRDTIEGEVDLQTGIANVLALITEDEILVAGIEQKIEQFNTRRAMFKRRIDACRTAIEQAMSIAGQETMRLPDATLSLKRTPPRAIVTDEASIPARFWKRPDPVLDKTALNAAARVNEDVPGMSISNGGFSLTIRRA